MIQYLRSILFSLIILPIFTLIVCVFIGPFFLLLPRAKFAVLIRFWVRCVHGLERFLLGLTYEVRGLEHVPKTGAFIVAAKHESTYETFKLHLLFDDPAIILKKELLSIPLWGWYLRRSGVIAIDRSTPEHAVVSVRDGAIAMAEAARPIIIFPQGTRVAYDASPADKPYKPGVFRVQEATGLPVVPMATNSGVFWPKGALLKKRGVVVFEFLPAIEAGLERAELMERLRDDIEEASSSLAREAL